MDFQFSVPFTKVDKARRMVTGIATADNIDKEYEFNKSTNKSVRRVKKYTMHELSLVDNPANPMSRFTMIKSHSNDDGENVLELEGTNNFSDIKPLFYCDIDGIAKVDESFCGDHEMKQIGFVEDFNTQEIRKMIESYENHKNGGEKSESVLHKNANTGIVNNMEELNETQKETIVKRLTKFIFDKENEVDTTEEGGDNVDTNEVVESVTSTLLEKLEEISKSFDAKIESLEKSVDEKVDSVKC